jgi:hypothetical protein
MKICPICGTVGRIWNKKPQVFICPNCLTFYSEFGMVMQSKIEHTIYWS